MLLKLKTLCEADLQNMSFCKFLLEKTNRRSGKHVLANKDKMQTVLDCITEYVLFFDNYLITRNQACSIARKMFYSAGNKDLNNGFYKVIQECLR